MKRPNIPTRRPSPAVAARLLATAAVVAVLSACGGAVDEASDAQRGTGTPGDGATESVTDAQDGSGNYATVTMGTMSYEIPADPLNLCNSLDGVIFGSFAVNANGEATQAGGTDVSIQVNFGLPVADWQDRGLQAPTLNVDLIDDGVRWFASTERQLGAVESWQLADGKASGEASFVGEAVGSGEAVGTATGSFEVLCR